MPILTHPNLPDQPITVTDGAVWHYRASGWQDAPEPEPVDYSNWSKVQLVEELDSRGLSTDGTKADLLARLDDSELTATEPAEASPSESPAES